MSKPDVIDVRSESYLPHDMDLLLHEFRHGKQVGESSGITAIDGIFTYKRGFLYVDYGWPNSGKTKARMFIMLVKSIRNKFKWIVLPDEMIGSIGIDGRVIKNANDIYDDLVHMYTGKSPYLHWKKKYNINQLSVDEYIKAHEFISKYFFVLDPNDKHYLSIIDTLEWAFDEFEADGCLIDPFSSVVTDETGRGDKDLDKVFKSFRKLALSKNAIVNFIGHGKNDKGIRNQDGSYKICNKEHLLGGSAWDNNFDTMISWHRPCAHLSINDPNFSMVTMINQKQRKQELTNRIGRYDNIEFDYFKNRYYFDGICPIDGEVKMPKQTNIPYQETWQATNNHIKEEEAPF